MSQDCAESDAQEREAAKHLTALADAGLASAERSGRETHYRLTPEPLNDAMRWMAGAGSRWDERFARLEKRLKS